MSATTDPADDVEQLDADTALKAAQVIYQRTNLETDTALELTQLRWEPWKVVATAMAAGGALVGGLVAAIVSLLLVVVR